MELCAGGEFFDSREDISESAAAYVVRTIAEVVMHDGAVIEAKGRRPQRRCEAGVRRLDGDSASTGDEEPMVMSKGARQGGRGSPKSKDAETFIERDSGGARQRHKNTGSSGGCICSFGTPRQAAAAVESDELATDGR
ncbi:hypothetical protein PIB30_078610 [Stylosanthes scabra]|uniref:Uncharacterized protein n=1 Tax=Stylosanthes scabra TaxID=79078 RepID=A0ABU6YNH4_9FABA|nr:hypothetical protein [Stylosanthes scabra]